MANHSGSSRPSSCVASHLSGLIHIELSVKPMLMYSFEPDTASTWKRTLPAIFLPKSSVTEELAPTKIAELLEVLLEVLAVIRASAFWTVPLTSWTVGAVSVRELGARIYSL